MPIYEFECTEAGCGKVYEDLFASADPPAPLCDLCGKPMRRRVSVSGFALKGTGWAKDHYGLKPAGGVRR